MKFFNIDLHISIIADMRKIFTDLGHEVYDKSLSDHTWVFNRPKDSVPMLDNGRWKQITPQQYSSEFYEQHKEEMEQYDAFIVTYPPPFSQLYDKFDKPIIINNPIRYEWPYSFRPKDWQYFNDFLRDGVDSGKIILVANNMYDKIYMEEFIERDVEFIPSICDYYGQYYNPTEDLFMYYYKGDLSDIKHPKIKSKSSLYSSHKHADLVKYKGIVHIPYQISYMSIFEQYTANIPLFVPTRKFLMELYRKGYNVLQEMTWNKCMSQPAKSSIPYKGKFDPNDYNDLYSVYHWIQYSDFYDEEWMPHIQQFESFSHLEKLVDTIDLNEISNNMKEFNKVRQSEIYDMWDNLIKTKVMK